MTDRARTKSTPARRTPKGLPPSYEQVQVPGEAFLDFMSAHGTREEAQRAATALASGKPLTVFAEGRGDARSVETLIDAAAAFEASPRARAILRGREIAIEDLKESGGTYTLSDVRKLLHDISRQRVDQLVKEGTLLALPGPSNSRRYPVLQFKDDGTLIEGLKAVQEALPTKNPWAILNFLLHGDDRLQGRKPIDVLRDGKAAAVIQAAKQVGEPGA